MNQLRLAHYVAINQPTTKGICSESPIFQLMTSSRRMWHLFKYPKQDLSNKAGWAGLRPMYSEEKPFHLSGFLTSWNRTGFPPVRCGCRLKVGRTKEKEINSFWSLAEFQNKIVTIQWWIKDLSQGGDILKFHMNMRGCVVSGSWFYSQTQTRTSAEKCKNLTEGREDAPTSSHGHVLDFYAS